MHPANATFDEIRIYEGVAERTGNQVDRAAVRGLRVLCRSVSDLAAKARRFGDGVYYMATAAWPENETSIVVSRPWDPLR